MTTAHTATLLHQAFEEERVRHAHRMADIKKGAKRLELFDSTFQALKERNCGISAGNLQFYGSDLSICAGGLPESDVLRYKALLELGYVEQDAPDNGIHYRTVKLKKGRLTVSIILPGNYKELAGA